MSPSCPTLVITVAGTLARAFASALRLMNVWEWLSRPAELGRRDLRARRDHRAAELFYVLSGSVQLLAGRQP
jgi:hypothetical protein